MGGASFVVFPSQWYETFGRIIIEAYAKGTPVVASRLGAITELVQDGRTGWLFEPHRVEDLVDKLQHAMAVCTPRAAIRTAAREAYLQDYTAAANLPVLLDIYRRAIGSVDLCLNRKSGAVSECLSENQKGDLRSDVSAGSETLAERRSETLAERTTRRTHDPC